MSLHLDELAALLEARAEPSTQQWWESYLKGAIRFRGVPMAGIRAAVQRWHAEYPSVDLRAAALEALRRPLAEDKLAGILILGELLLPAGRLSWRRDLPALADVFDQGHIADWGTCDWLCVKVLGPLTKQEGEECARAIATWTGAPVLWRRRAAAVAFVGLATDGDGFFPGFVDLVLEVARGNVLDPERFAQTGVGWVLRELSAAAPEEVAAFLRAHREVMSREALRMAAARLSDYDRADLGITGRRRRR